MTLNATDVNGNNNNPPVIQYEKGTILNHVDIPTIDTDYTFVGYADSENNIVIDKDGNLNNYSLDNDLTLKALFTYKAYVVTDSFKNGNDYLIAYNNNFLSAHNFQLSPGGLEAKQLIINVDILNKNYVTVEQAGDNFLWNYRSNGILYNYGKKEFLYDYNKSGVFYLIHSGTSSNWTYSSTDGILSSTRKVSYENGYFVARNDGVKIDIYELGDVTTDKYLPRSGGGV